MGKKSRLKKERRELKKQGLIEKSFNNFLNISEKKMSIYRFFAEAWQADTLVAGKVWISTLETCRKYEDPLKGDPEEAYESYNSGHAVGGSDDPNFVEIARRTGIRIGDGCSHNTISNCTRVTSLLDAYVICSTIEFLPNTLSNTFGKFCIEITDPKLFFIYVSECLGEKEKIKEAAAGKVIYKDRNYKGLEQPPGPIGFVKPPDKYASQKEFRFLWIPKDSKQIKPFLLECPSIISLCKRII